MKAVILGCGHVGSYLARRLQEEGYQATVIDGDSAAFGLGAGFDGAPAAGTGIDQDVLRRILPG